MSNYNFDEIIDRRNTNCCKYDFADEFNKPKDALPMWVADMDFRAPDPVIDGLKSLVDHGIFGYTDTKADYDEAVIGWFNKRFGVELSSEWMSKTPGVVFALSNAIRSFTEPEDAVMIQPPVYYPFFNIVKDNGRTVIENHLKYEDGRYTIDFNDFEQKIIDNDVKMFILCSPHNPVGRVWTIEELREIVEICKKYNVIIASDEIHCDFVYEGHEHIPLIKACPDYSNNMIICTAPSKTFNIAGMQVSNIFIPNKELKQKFDKEMRAVAYLELNIFGIKACTEAYKHGEEWLEELKGYLKGNLDYIRDFIRERLPEVKLIEPDGTYLVWLDMSGLGKSKEELNDLILNKAKLWLDAGDIFSDKCEQFQRVVIACPRELIVNAMESLERAIREGGNK